MTGKYTQVVDANWDDRILFPESVPHLFHFDLLYLWMLEKDPDRRSRTWRERIEGWHYLASLFLLGELQVSEESIREPFLAYTRPFGIERVAWLTGRDNPERLGVLSPTVLVRPLPDFTGVALDRWRQTHGNLDRRGDEIRHFADLAISRLREGENKGLPSYRTRLAAVLERELGHARLSSYPAGRSISIPILRSLGWARPRVEAERPVLVDLLIREGGDDRSTKAFVPRCSFCNDLLTRTQEAPAIEVRGASFNVACARGHLNELPLADFLIWYRGKSQVVVWNDERLVPLDKGVPPSRTIQGIEVAMEWNAGRVEGSQQRFLRLAFPETTVREHRLNEIFFDKLVVPGRLQDFRGLPIRFEWLDVLQNPDQIEPDVEPSVPRIAYRSLRLGGWPVPVPKVFGGLSLQVREDLALGLFPDPAKVGSDWKWFRAFLDGPGRREHRVTCAQGSAILAWAVEVTSGPPKFISLESPSDARAGAIFHVGRPNGTATGSQTAIAHVGIDFGTSNTLIAFHRLGPGGDRGKAETLKPEEVLPLVLWLAQPVSNWQEATGDFLPPRGYRENTGNSSIFPSALWILPRSEYMIRWEGREPFPGAEPLGGFKWDPDGGDFSPQRHAYLREVLLLTLPAILSHMSRAHRISKLHLGFAYPLAFDHEARQKMLALSAKLADDLLRLTGLTAQFGYISESAACVRAFGKPQAGDTYLVADMGGGTIDVVLFTASSSQAESNVNIHQIGSLRFAGEHYIQALALKKGGRAGWERLSWQLRDQISEGQARALYGNDADAKRILNRLVAFALEFLRTMVLAHRKNHDDRPIRFVFVGNGWHLADALNERAKQIGATKFFLECYRNYIHNLGEPGLSLYQEGPIKDLPTTKHLVVLGALANTVKDQQDGLVHEANPSKLPAGRSMVFNPPGRLQIPVAWERIIGEDGSVALTDAFRTDLQTGYLDFNLDDMPPLSASWKEELFGAFGIRDQASIPYPTKEQLRDLVEVEQNRIERGPLQVILEECWKEELSR